MCPTPAWCEYNPVSNAARVGQHRAVGEQMPGVRAMPLESTYLAWLDFSGTGLDPTEVTRRVERDAKVAVNHGPTFGKGGETWLRFNFACPRATLSTAIERLVGVFGKA